MRVLDIDNSFVRVCAAWSLATLGSIDPKIVEALLHLVTYNNKYIIWSALEGIGDLKVLDERIMVKLLQLQVAPTTPDDIERAVTKTINKIFHAEGKQPFKPTTYTAVTASSNVLPRDTALVHVFKYMLDWISFSQLAVFRVVCKRWRELVDKVDATCSFVVGPVLRWGTGVEFK